MRHNAKLTRIEMFLASFKTIPCLHVFSNLITLQLLGQEVESLEGLKCCQHLENLWIVEASLQSMAGLQHLQKLRHVHLYSNRLTAISHIFHLTNLQVLWLADNSITSLDGLASQVSLMELNVASNPINQVNGALAHMLQLQVLNLSHTDVASFREIAALAALTSLRELHFNDPNWGPAPLSKLANYQTMALYKLPQLEVCKLLMHQTNSTGCH